MRSSSWRTFWSVIRRRRSSNRPSTANRTPLKSWATPLVSLATDSDRSSEPRVAAQVSRSCSDTCRSPMRPSVSLIRPTQSNVSGSQSPTTRVASSMSCSARPFTTIGTRMRSDRPSSSIVGRPWAISSRTRSLASSSVSSNSTSGDDLQAVCSIHAVPSLPGRTAKEAPDTRSSEEPTSSSTVEMTSSSDSASESRLPTRARRRSFLSWTTRRRSAATWAVWSSRSSSPHPSPPRSRLTENQRRSSGLPCTPSIRSWRTMSSSPGWKPSMPASSLRSSATTAAAQASMPRDGSGGSSELPRPASTPATPRLKRIEPSSWTRMKPRERSSRDSGVQLSDEGRCVIPGSRSGRRLRSHQPSTTPTSGAITSVIAMMPPR